MSINISCTINSTYTQHFGVMCASLFEHNPQHQFEIFLIYDHIAEEEKEKIEMLFQKYQQKITFISFKLNDLIAKYPLSNHAHYANYYRLFLTELLPQEVKKVIYLDCDLLVLTDVMPLWEMNEKEINRYSLWAVSEGTSEPKAQALGIENPENYFNSGVMLINLQKWREENLLDKFMSFVQSYPEKIELWDQDVLNAVCKDYGLLPSAWNTKSCQNIKKKKIYILHYTGIHKPWHYLSKHNHKNLYFKYLKKTPWKNFKMKDKTIGNFLRKHKIMPIFIEKILSKNV